MEIKDLIRENIKSLEAYSSARDEFKAMSSEFVFIDANENQTNLKRCLQSLFLLMRMKILLIQV